MEDNRSMEDIERESETLRARLSLLTKEQILSRLNATRAEFYRNNPIAVYMYQCRAVEKQIEIEAWERAFSLPDTRTEL